MHIACLCVCVCVGVCVGAGDIRMKWPREVGTVSGPHCVPTSSFTLEGVLQEVLASFLKAQDQRSWRRTQQELDAP